MVRSYFLAMHRRKLIPENPFEGVHMAAAGVKDRQQFVSRGEIEKVLAVCPDDDWRMIVLLSRYGGLRCPSEVLSLRWQDIDWERSQLHVRSPKTEHIADKAIRTVPLFPELRPMLVKARAAARAGAVYVVNERFRKGALGPAGWKNANLRTTFRKIVTRAGLKVWPRLFHNLRASRETELFERFPPQEVTQWLGNTPAVAMRHYLMTTDAHFEAAVQQEGAGEKAAQIPAQQLRAGGRNASQRPPVKTKNPAIFGAFLEITKPCDWTQVALIEGSQRSSE